MIANNITRHGFHLKFFQKQNTQSLRNVTRFRKNFKRHFSFRRYVLTCKMHISNLPVVCGKNYFQDFRRGQLHKSGNVFLKEFWNLTILLTYLWFTVGTIGFSNGWLNIDEANLKFVLIIEINKDCGNLVWFHSFFILEEH